MFQIEDEDQYDQDLDVENELQVDLDLDTILAPNKRPKWAQNLIEVAQNIVGDPDDRRRTRSQYHNEHVALYHSYPLLPERCFMMMGPNPRSYKEAFHDPRWHATMDNEFGFLKDNKIWDLITFPPGMKLV